MKCVLILEDEPFIALGPSVPATCDYWLGRELRGGEPARIGGEANTVSDAILGIAHLGLVTLGCASAVRAFARERIATPRAGVVAIADEWERA